jgi:hypothetical protein
MKINRIITTGVLALAISSFSTTAFATTGDATGTPAASDTSTTVPAKKDPTATSKFRSDMQAWQTATKTWITARAAITKEHRESVAAASATLGAALNAATTKEARKSAMETFKAAREAAKTKLDAAIAALGERPVRPSR